MIFEKSVYVTYLRLDWSMSNANCQSEAISKEMLNSKSGIFKTDYSSKRVISQKVWRLDASDSFEKSKQSLLAILCDSKRK